MTTDLTPPDPLDLCWFECNDYGNARRAEVLAAGLLKWVDDKFWLAFDGQRWSEREGHYRARALAHEVAQHIHDEAAALGDLMGPNPKAPDEAALQRRYGDWITPALAQDRLAMLHKHALKSGNAAQTEAMLKQAQSLPGLRAWGDLFDRDPLAYNVQNGVVRFAPVDGPPPPGAKPVPTFAEGSGGASRTGGGNRAWQAWFTEGHDPGDMFRQISNWTYQPGAECPQWLARLDLVQPDADIRACLPRMYGQTLTGLTDCEEFYVHKGRGGDGKTKTHEILTHGHGDYYRHAQVNSFLQASFQKSGAEHRADLVDLSGDVRMVLCDEPPRNATWDGAVIKQVTGGGEVTARGAGDKKPIVFKPRWKLFVEVNPTPSMPGDDKGFRRRFRLVQWLVDLSLTPDGFEPPAQLRERLWAEQAGVLNWLIAGCIDWLGDRRIPMPEREVEALADFWATGNPLGEWLDEECDLTRRDATTGFGVLWDAFKAWMERSEIEEEARKKWNITRFGRELGQRQVVGIKDRRGQRLRKGIVLRGEDPLLGGATSAEKVGTGFAPGEGGRESSGEGWPDWEGEDPLGDM